MIATIKSEFLKLLTVRSTYFVMLLSLIFVAISTFYVEGYWGQSGSAAGALQPTAIKEIIGMGVGLAAVFISIIAILQTGHEYRYNTISYTMSSNAHRTQIFLAKAFVLSCFGVVFGLFVAGFSVVSYFLGLQLRDASLPAQDLNLLSQLLHVTVYSIIYSLFGFLLAILLRSIVGAIVLFMTLPAIVEPLLGLILKENAAYLPIATFDQILGVSIGEQKLTSNTAMLISALYITVLGIIGWLAFVKRDSSASSS